MQKRKIYLHVGLHKTGTTSIQRHLEDHKEAYAQQGLHYSSAILPHNNAGEIAMLIMRDGVFSKVGDATKRAVTAHLEAFLDRNSGKDLIFSGEDLSYMRTPEECLRLKRLLRSEGAETVAVLVNRDMDEWWSSYCNQMEKVGVSGSATTHSRAYLDKNGWLTDIRTLRDLLYQHFDQVVEIDYGPKMVSQFVRTLELPAVGSIKEYRLNKRAPRWKVQLDHAMWNPRIEGTMLQRWYTSGKELGRKLMSRR